MLYKLGSCIYYKEMNSISFKASVQILYIVLCNYCTTCVIYRDKIKFNLSVSTQLEAISGNLNFLWNMDRCSGPDINEENFILSRNL